MGADAIVAGAEASTGAATGPVLVGGAAVAPESAADSEERQETIAARSSRVTGKRNRMGFLAFLRK
ncbi:MAG: hypothetical protein E2O39_14625 [Planctomycetota bacterium]|nr:MAG: hypothetical protein E2O39_14625 [Planctomycetota bacterium]